MKFFIDHLLYQRGVVVAYNILMSLPNINMLVDIGNIISIKHMLPVGVHAIDLVNSDILVHKATGARLFNLLDLNNLNIHYKEKLSLLREKRC